MTDELVALAQRLIGFETCEPEGIAEAAGFVKGWLDARGIEAVSDEVRGLPVLKAEVGPEEAPTVVLHGHIDVVPAHADLPAAVARMARPGDLVITLGAGSIGSIGLKILEALR